jgi:hypothetical protein
MIRRNIELGLEILQSKTGEVLPERCRNCTHLASRLLQETLGDVPKVLDTVSQACPVEVRVWMSTETYQGCWVEGQSKIQDMLNEERDTFYRRRYGQA